MFGYHRLPTLELEGSEKYSSQDSRDETGRKAQWKAVAVGSVMGILAGLMMSAGGLLYVERAVHHNHIVAVHGLSLMVPPGNVPVDFVHNDTFELEPSAESEAAWETIIPSGMGFVQHPNLGPEIAGLAFVHQLHCVDRLRKGYYSALAGNETHQTTHHIKHCLEYLRNAIMCHGDTNLEYREVHEDTGEVGTSGYTKHHCRDFNQLHDFAEKWRVWNGKGRPQQERISEVENIPGRRINYDYISSRGDPLPST